MPFRFSQLLSCDDHDGGCDRWKFRMEVAFNAMPIDTVKLVDFFVQSWV